VKLQSLLDDGAKQRLSQLLGAARQRVTKPESQSSEILAALPLLARGLDERDEADVSLLSSFLAPQQVPEVRSAAVTALARTGRSETPKLLLANWAAHSPSLRNQILDALAAREAWALAVLEAVESGQVAAAQFDARRQQQFVTSRNKAVREKAEKVLVGAVDTNRQKLVDAYLV